jgi:Domain of unknown function (DUF4224)
MFLSPDQLKQLTGRRQSAAQRRWLSSAGIRFRVRADGKPVVMQTDLQGSEPPPALTRKPLI